MTINVSEALDIDTAEIVIVERATAGAYVDGIYQPGSTSLFKTICSVQQPSPEELQTLPGGERIKDVRKFISKRQIRTSDDKTTMTADVVLYQNERYKIISSGDWNIYGHTTSFGAREQ